VPQPLGCVVLPKQFEVDDLQHQHSIMIVRFNDLRARMIVIMRQVERQSVELAKLRRAVERQKTRYEREWLKTSSGKVSGSPRRRVS
jgi:hypothetical protein